MQPEHYQIIAADWIIPMTQNDHWLEKHALVINEQVIIDILPQNIVKTKYPNASLLQLNQQVIMPGFVNGHCHAAMSLLRGLSDDKSLMDWLNNAIWPVEKQFVDNDFVYQGTQLAIAEMLLSGTTCFQDMYFMPDQTIKAVLESGIRASVGLIVTESETAWSKNAQEGIDKGLDLFDGFKHAQTINFNFSPHAIYTVAQNNLEKIVTLSNELNLPVQMHIHETQDEINNYVKQEGVRPLTRLREIGLLSPLLNAVHMTKLNSEEIDWLAESGSHVIHCPQSNMKLTSGTCPTHKLTQAGVNLSIGTDGAASNNDLDMIDETRSASLLAKLDSMEPSALSAYQSLYAATLGGAKALGLQDKIGSLEKNKQADFIAIDLNRISTQPVYNPISQIVYAAARDQVSHVWVNGQLLVENQQLKTLNSESILHNTAEWRAKIINR
jgi:5-methylthioadenosine/S-adenosylhomocysteine deaminase